MDILSAFTGSASGPEGECRRGIRRILRPGKELPPEDVFYGDRMKPFSNEIVFFDSEFSSLNPYRGEILSIGLVKLTGEELYMELEHPGEVDEWVQKNVMPMLIGPKIGREEAAERVRTFVGTSKPYMMAYVNQFDWIYWIKLAGTKENPFHWIPMDFASILFAYGRDPQSYDWRQKENLFRELGIDPTRFRQHHALEDARLLRETYLTFTGSPSGRRAR